MYKRNGCFSLVYVYFIFFHLFRNAQAVGSSPTISSKKRQRRFFFSVFFIRLNLIIAYSIHMAVKNLPYEQHFLFFLYAVLLNYQTNFVWLAPDKSYRPRRKLKEPVQLVR